MSVGSAPTAAITGPPMSNPAELPALTITDCPDNNARRSDPADDLVIRIEIAAIPSTTVTPDSAPNAATATGVVHTPIPIHPSPIDAQAIVAIGIGGTRLTTANETLVPTTAPTPYPDIPAARYTPGRPRAAPSTDSPSVNANHVNAPLPRMIHPYSTSGRCLRLPLIDGIVSASGERSPTTLTASTPATSTAAASIHNNPSINPTATAAAPIEGPTTIPTRRFPSCQVSNITALSGPQRSPVSASNALRPGVASASPAPATIH